MNLFDLHGKVGIVTGAAGILGHEHVTALAAAGATVYLTDVHESALEQARLRLDDQLKGVVHTLVLDVTSRESISAAAAAMRVNGHEPDILVNNAAIDPKVSNRPGMLETSRFEHFSIDDWNLQIAVGLTGAFLCSQIFGQGFAERGGGVILNIASDLSVISPDQRIYRRAGAADDQQPVKPVTYSVIKTGLIGLTRYLATYWADRNVRVNALSPGGVYAQQPAAFVERLVNLIPLGRMATADEYHGAVQFLCSDASAYLTGQNIVMDGGRSVW